MTLGHDPGPGQGLEKTKAHLKGKNRMAKIRRSKMKLIKNLGQDLGLVQGRDLGLRPTKMAMMKTSKMTAWTKGRIGPALKGTRLRTATRRKTCAKTMKSRLKKIIGPGLDHLTTTTTTRKTMSKSRTTDPGRGLGRPVLKMTRTMTKMMTRVLTMV